VHELKKREELKAFSENRISLNLLLNGNCYGAESLARSFFLKLGDTVEELFVNFGVESVTTASPVIARFIKANFDNIQVRASVNMEIGTIEGMDYLAELFDGFYLKREYNRNFAHIKKMKAWCELNGKKLFMLANSGCLNNCSSHHFHDNIVAHQSEIARLDNAYDFQGICWDYLRKAPNIDKYLINTSFIRPEDIYIYEQWFDCVKLATRASKFPERILRSYIEGSYIGSVMNLLEPDHSGAVLPMLIENSSIPESFAQTVGGCNKACDSCDYCKRALRKALIVMEDK